MIVVTIVLAIAGLLVGGGGGAYAMNTRVGRAEQKAKEEAKKELAKAKKEAEETIKKANEEADRRVEESRKDEQKRRQELKEIEQRLINREDSFDKKLDAAANVTAGLQRFQD